jgi:hypothetical protein
MTFVNGYPHTTNNFQYHQQIIPFRLSIYIFTKKKNLICLFLKIFRPGQPTVSVCVLQLTLSLCFGPMYVKQKIYQKS